MRLVTSAEMSEIDSRAQDEIGIPAVALMESAGKAAWDHLNRYHLENKPGQSIVFVAGGGNNGGDVLVMARYCAIEGVHRPTVLFATASVRGVAETQKGIVAAMGIPLLQWQSDRVAAEEQLRHADWIIDGLAGTGLTGPLRPPQSEMAHFINSTRAQVAAVDVPSGVGDHGIPSGEVVRARVTLTLGLPKRCLYGPVQRGYCGRIAVIPFGIPTELAAGAGPAAELLERDDLTHLLPALPSTFHKGQRGVLAVFAGSIGTTGAAVLSTQSALSAGAGLVTLFVDKSVYVPLASQLTSVMVRPEEESIVTGPANSDRFGAAVVGPGWGISDTRPAQLLEIMKSFKRGVIDADGLTLLSEADSPRKLAEWVLTPHPAELGRLVGAESDVVLADMYGTARRAAQLYGAVVVAKASTTIIANPDGRIAVVDGMNASLATAGSGDVLAGVIGALLSRGIPGWDAARAGPLIHAEAGRRYRSSRGFYRSSELSSEIGRVVGEVVLQE